MKKFKFIDLFSGIGGFHQAMVQLGGECILASDTDKYCNEVYLNNYGIRSNINIKDVDETTLPKFEVLCAGFPCQSFSISGNRKGFEDKDRGNLFFEIVRIAKHCKPKYLVLENVKNIITHDNGNTWKVIQDHIRDLGYRTTAKPLVLSPHYFGIPQNRERVFILGKYDPDNIDIPIEIDLGKFKSKEENSIYSIIDNEDVDEEYGISEQRERAVNIWEEFYHGIKTKTLGFPVWADYFKYDGDYEGMIEYNAKVIKKNIALYKENKDFIDQWLEKHNYLRDFFRTFRKFEWNCGTAISSLWDGIIYFRSSGVRVQKPTVYPTIIKINGGKVVIGKLRRRLTIKELARLQSFRDDFIHHKSKNQAHFQIGNSVNVECVKRAAEALFKSK